jgi:hypothetical protein
LYGGVALPEQVVKPKAPSKPKVATIPCLTEHEEQVHLHKWLNAKQLPHSSIPNAQAMSFTNRDVAVKVMAKLKCEGFSPGFPDLIIFLPQCLLFLELKRVKGSEVNDDQLDWMDTINSYSYAKGIIAYGFEDAKKQIEGMLGWI